MKELEDHAIIPTPEKMTKKRDAARSFKARANEKRSRFDKIADFMTESFGSVGFLLFNAIFFFVWITWNTGTIPGIPVLDPFPFGLLTMVVSLEAIFLAIIVLISQNRAANIADLREELELYVGTYAEAEVTKIMYLLTLLLKKNDVDISQDSELRLMLTKLECNEIESQLEQELQRFN